MNLKKLLAFLYDFTSIGMEDPFITSIEMDSRDVKPGCLFICIKGNTVNGHDFAKVAEQSGAAAILAEKDVQVDVPVVKVKDSRRAMAVLADAFYGQPTHKLHLVGVTGTNGKTTTAHFIEQIFRDAGKKTGMIGTINMKIGDKIYEVKNTTPESLTLQKTFKEMIDKDVNSAVMEVSSHALDLGRVHGTDFNVAVFTNLSQDHLDYHQTMAEYRRAKGLLFAQLGSRFDQAQPKFAVLNNDDSATKEFIKSTAATVITYGIDQQSDFTAENVVTTSSGTFFDLITPTERLKVKIKLIGKFSVYNVLAALSVGVVSNIPLPTIIKTIENLEGVQGRFEVVNEGQDFTVIVDYAHTPDSLENVLTTVKQFSKGKIYVVVGCGGDRDRSKRPLMAKIATKYADVPIFTSDNPRSEDPVAILHDMESGVEGERYYSIVERKEAIHFAISQAHENDVILIAGKGHETYQLIGSEILDFDDRLIAAEIIKERNL